MPWEYYTPKLVVWQVIESWVESMHSLPFSIFQKSTLCRKHCQYVQCLLDYCGCIYNFCPLQLAVCLFHGGGGYAQLPYKDMSTYSSFQTHGLSLFCFYPAFLTQIFRLSSSVFCLYAFCFSLFYMSFSPYSVADWLTG